MKRRMNNLFRILCGALVATFSTHKSAAAELCVASVSSNISNTTEPIGIGWFFASLALGAVISLVAVFCMVRALKSVRRAPRADSYIVKGSMYLDEKRDIYLYKDVEKRPRPKQNGRDD